MTKDERNKIKDNIGTEEEDYFGAILAEVEDCLKKHPKPLFHIMNLIIEYRDQARMEILGKINKRNESKEAELKKIVKEELNKNNLI